MKKLLLLFTTVSICLAQTTPDLTNKQRYLDGFVNGSRPHRGINIKPVWNIGYYGQGIHVADIQYDWDLDHEDLADKNIQAYYENSDMGQQQHGTNAIGIIGADKNDFGMTGIAHGCEMSVYDIYDEMAGIASWGRSIKAAADRMNPGDIIQLEISLVPQGSNTPLPPEINPPLHEAIKYAVNKGMIVLQAAGNGNSNLDNSSQMPYDDNGSIMVGGASENQVRVESIVPDRIDGSNYGNRVNVHAWGDTIVATLGTWNYAGAVSGVHGITYGNSDHRAYNYQFSGTSSALPIVSGVCAVIQSFAKDSLGYTLTSQEMRDLLIQSGHPQDSSSVSGHIGPIPDAERAIQILLGDTPIAKSNKFAKSNFCKIKNNVLNINNSVEDVNILITNIAGQIIETIRMKDQTSLDLSRYNFAKGFYILNINSNKHNASIKWHNR